MNNAYFEVTLGVNYILDHGLIKGFYLVSGIKDVLPFGYIEYSDESGRIFAEFKGLATGTPVKIQVFNGGATDEQFSNKDPEAIIEWPEYVVLGVETDGAKAAGLYAGLLTIWFGHPWFLYTDTKDHAYDPMNSTELIKKVLEDEARGVKFEVTEENFEKTDDAGKYPRYKVGKTDYEFLLHHVLPYCAIKQTPTHLFCDDRGEWNLKSFEGMYKDVPVVMFGPDEADRSEYLDDMKKMAETAGITNVYQSSYASVTVAGEKYMAEVAPRFAVENTTVGTVITGGKVPGNKLQDRAGDNFGNLLPLDVGFMAKLVGTSYKIIKNRPLLDALTLLFAGSAVLDEAFVVRIDSEFCGVKLQIGKTALLYVPPLEYPPEHSKSGNKEKKRHWLYGKWLCQGLIHRLSSEDAKRLESTTYLTRSAFVGNEELTSIKQPILLHEVP